MIGNERGRQVSDWTEEWINHRRISEKKICNKIHIGMKKVNNKKIKKLESKNKNKQINTHT